MIRGCIPTHSFTCVVRLCPTAVAYNRGLVLGKKPVVSFSWGVPTVEYLESVKVQ